MNKHEHTNNTLYNILSQLDNVTKEELLLSCSKETLVDMLLVMKKEYSRLHNLHIASEQTCNYMQNKLFMK